MADVSAPAATRADRSRRLARLAARRNRVEVRYLRVVSIILGGGVGALARAAVGKGLPHSGGEWPWATFSVNLFGALFLAWLMTRLSEMVAPTRYWRFLLGTGFCGALTTFSTFQVEAIALAKDGHPGLAVAYATASIAAGMAVAVGATTVARRRRYG
jgi:fluoride exporter